MKMYFAAAKRFFIFIAVTDTNPGVIVSLQDSVEVVEQA